MFRLSLLEYTPPGKFGLIGPPGAGTLELRPFPDSQNVGSSFLRSFQRAFSKVASHSDRPGAHNVRFWGLFRARTSLTRSRDEL